MNNLNIQPLSDDEISDMSFKMRSNPILPESPLTMQQQVLPTLPTTLPSSPLTMQPRILPTPPTTLPDSPQPTSRSKTLPALPTTLTESPLTIQSQVLPTLPTTLPDSPRPPLQINSIEKASVPISIPVDSPITLGSASPYAKSTNLNASVSEGDSIVYSPNRINSVVDEKEGTAFFSDDAKIDVNPKPVHYDDNSQLSDAEECKILVEKSIALQIIDLVNVQVESARQNYVNKRDEFKTKIADTVESGNFKRRELKETVAQNINNEIEKAKNEFKNSMRDILSKLNISVQTTSSTELNVTNTKNLSGELVAISKLLEDLSQDFEDRLSKIKSNREIELKNISDKIGKEYTDTETEKEQFRKSSKERFFKEKFARIPRESNLNIECLLLVKDSYKKGKILYIEPEKEKPIIVDCEFI